MPHPKNIEAVRAWILKFNGQHELTMFDDMLRRAEDRTTQAGQVADAIVAYVLKGFEAGRVFQKEHPRVKSGSGY